MENSWSREVVVACQLREEHARPRALVVGQTLPLDHHHESVVGRLPEQHGLSRSRLSQQHARVGVGILLQTFERLPRSLVRFST